MYCQNRENNSILLYLVRGKKPTTLSLSQLRELIVTLTIIHQAGYVHGDVKPSNIIIQKNGSVVLIDFGLSRKRYNLNGRFGTSGYMAPEVSRGDRNHNTSIDWWSLGITAKNLLNIKSIEARNLIGRMLERNPIRRFERCQNLLNHPIFD